MSFASPSIDELIERIEARGSFNEVTWKILNDQDFGNSINKKFPKEAFTEPYGKRNAISEKRPAELRPLRDDDWPDEIDNEPTGL